MPVANAATFTFKPPSSPSLMNSLILLLLVNSTSLDHLNKKTPLFHYLQKLQKIQLKYSVSNQINRNEMPHPQGNMIQNVHYNAFLRKLDHTFSKGAMYYIHKKLMKYISPPEKGTYLPHIYLQPFTHHLHTNVYSKVGLEKFGARPCLCKYVVRKSSQTYTKYIARKWIYFEIPLISKILERVFTDALLLLHWNFGTSFFLLWRQRRYGCSLFHCCAKLDRPRFMNRFFLFCDLQVLFDSSLRNIQIIYLFSNH